MRRAIGTATVLVALVALAMPASGIAAKTVKVKVLDDYYSPAKVSIKKKDKISFKWDKFNLNTHNVKLKKGPNSVKINKKPCSKAKGDISKCNYSQSGSVGINFTPTFDVKGTYNFICTIHPSVMKLKVEVKK